MSRTQVAGRHVGAIIVKTLIVGLDFRISHNS